MSKQKTLKGSFSLCGKGLHTGLSLTVTFNPAPENTGYKIQRIDLEGEPIIQAVAENVVETQRGTVLGKGRYPHLYHRAWYVSTLCPRHRQLFHPGKWS